MPNTYSFHSQLVGWAKILLPLCALGLLSTLFLFARGTTEPSDFALSEVAEIAREQRVSAPQFSGVTDNGSVIVVSARSARPDVARGGTLTIDEIRVRLDAIDGSFVAVSAVQGEVDNAAQVARLFGLARMETSNGYEMETNGLTAELTTGLLESEGVLEIRAPFGELTAGKVTVQAKTQTSGQQMLFTNGVRLLYTP